MLKSVCARFMLYGCMRWCCTVLDKIIYHSTRRAWHGMHRRLALGLRPVATYSMLLLFVGRRKLDDTSLQIVVLRSIGDVLVGSGFVVAGLSGLLDYHVPAHVPFCRASSALPVLAVRTGISTSVHLASAVHWKCRGICHTPIERIVAVPFRFGEFCLLHMDMDPILSLRTRLVAVPGLYMQLT